MDYSKPFRCHPSIIIENVFRSIWIILAGFIFSVDDIIKAITNADKIGADALSMLIGAGVLLAIIIIFFVFFYLRWRKTLIHFEEQILVVEKNFLLSKKRITIPLEKIATVDYSQNFFERMIGTCRLKLDVNSSVLAEKTDLRLVFKLSLAQQIKNYIIGGVHGGVNSEMQQKQSENISESVKTENKPDKQVSFTVMDILKYTIIDTKAIALFFSVGITIGIPVLAALLPQTFIDNTLAELDNQVSRINGPIVILFILIMLFLVFAALFVIGFVVGFIKNVFTFYDFKASRDRNIISISYGLVNLKKYSFPVSKITSVTVKRSFFARITGYCCVEVQTIGLGDEKNESPLICPACSRKNYNKIMSDFLPEFMIEGEEKRPPKSALAVNLINTFIFMLLIYLPVAVIISLIQDINSPDILKYYSISFAGLTVLIALFVYLFYRTRSVTVNDSNTMISSGVIAKRSIIIQNRSIQHTHIKQGPLTRLFGLYNTDISLIFTFKNGRINTGLFPLNVSEAISEQMVKNDYGFDVNIR